MTPKASAHANLTDSQLTHLRDLLEKKRSELTARLQSVHGRVGGEHEAHADPVDRATESQEDAEELGVADPDDRILGQVERALSKLRLGTYGLSEVSGEPIGFDRLAALPWATQSAQEKQMREKRSR